MTEAELKQFLLSNLTLRLSIKRERLFVSLVLIDDDYHEIPITDDYVELSDLRID